VTKTQAIAALDQDIRILAAEALAQADQIPVARYRLMAMQEAHRLIGEFATRWLAQIEKTYGATTH
jgi:hypothetical protein